MPWLVLDPHPLSARSTSTPAATKPAPDADLLSVISFLLKTSGQRIAHAVIGLNSQEPDGGHGNLPVGGHRNSPLMATGSGVAPSSARNPASLSSSRAQCSGPCQEPQSSVY